MQNSRRDNTEPADFEDLSGALPKGELIKIIRKRVSSKLVKPQPGYLKRFLGWLKDQLYSGPKI